MFGRKSDLFTMLRKKLYQLTASKPIRMIYSNGSPYLERYYLGGIGSMRFYLHRFVSGDGDRALHDHPWKRSLAICLAGGYLEQRIKWFNPETAFDVAEKTIWPGKFNLIKAATFHQIMHTKPETWTLFMHGRKIKPWGFINKTTITDSKGEPRLVSHYLEDSDPDSHHNWWDDAPTGADSDRADLTPPS